jgi:hypothetical protein
MAIHARTLTSANIYVNTGPPLFAGHDVQHQMDTGTTESLQRAKSRRCRFSNEVQKSVPDRLGSWCKSRNLRIRRMKRRRCRRRRRAVATFSTAKTCRRPARRSRPKRRLLPLPFIHRQQRRRGEFPRLLRFVVLATLRRCRSRRRHRLLARTG